MTHPSEIRKPRKIISGIIPSHQDRVLKLDAQGLRPGQIAYAMGLRVGGTSAVCDVLTHYGRPIDLLQRRLAS
jgi:hypothetical protein